jgi:hypothetical protein
MRAVTGEFADIQDSDFTLVDFNQLLGFEFVQHARGKGGFAHRQDREILR